VRELLVALGIAIAVWLVVVGALMLAGRAVEAKQVARLLPDLAALLRGLLHDPGVPRRSKVLVGLAMVWVVSPIDLLPEFLPIIGPLDDVIVVALVLRHLIKRAAPDGRPRTQAWRYRDARTRVARPPAGWHDVLVAGWNLSGR
jgi:uncharacterized membrane protein YkvA (DUF1232 family)